MKLLIAMTAMFALVGCNSQDFDGKLIVDDQLTLKGDRGMVTIAVGEYETELEIEGKKEIDLKITDGDNTRKITIKTKDEIKKSSKGRISLPADRTNQNYDLVGDIHEAVKTGQKQRDYEPCTFQEPYTVCYPTGRRGGVRCTTHWRTMNGYRDVEYREQVTTSDLEVRVSMPNTTDVLATFTGRNIEFDRLYSYEGICR